jgi:hypothetical protein
MHRFLSDNLLLLDTLSEDLPEEFTSLYQLHHSKLFSSVNITINDHTLNPEGGMSDDQDCELQYKWAVILPGSDIRLPTCCSRYILQPFQAEIIHKMYSKLYKVPMEDVEMPMACFKYSSVKLSEIQFGSCKSLSSSSSIVIVKWDVELIGSPVFPSGFISEPFCPGHNQILLRPARINFVLQHGITINSLNLTHVLVSLTWYKYHGKHNVYGKPITVWENDLYMNLMVFTVIFQYNSFDLEQSHLLTNWKMSQVLYCLYVVVLTEHACTHCM